MSSDTTAMLSQYETIVTEDGQIMERVRYDFSLSRRGFVQALGAGIVIATAAASALSQRGPENAAGEIGARAGGRGAFGNGNGAQNLDARLHIGQDGTITVMSGKVEGGQGSRAEISQAAAEELRVPLDRIIKPGNLLSFFAGLGFLVAVLTGHMSVTVAVVVMFVFTVGMSIASPGALSKAMSTNPAVIGSASGLYGFTQMSIGALCTVLAGLTTHPALGAALVMTGAGIVAQLCFWFALRKR